MKKHILSYSEITIPSKQKSRALSLILSSSLTYKRAFSVDTDNFVIEISQRYAERYEKLFRASSIEYRLKKTEGIFSFISCIKGRIGVLFGLLFLFSVLIFSSNIVWKINIHGNSIATREEILNELENAGFSLGTFIPGIDYDGLHNSVLLNSDCLSWITVNVTGNVADVYVREKSKKKDKVTPAYSNVIAAYDGYIEKIIVENGKKEVSVGQVVKKGDILISGVIDSQSEGVRYEQAKGEVFAYVSKQIKVEIPYISEEKAYTGNKYVYKNYKIYNFPIKFSTKYGNQALFYDKIEQREYASIFGIEGLPFEVITTTLYEYEFKKVELTKEEAVDRAFKDLRWQLDTLLENAELISKTVTTSYDENGFYIECELYCLENIAKIQEFYVTK